MKSLDQQLSDKCIHFNGTMNECCKAGIKYTDVRDDSERPYKFPCLKQGGNCSHSKFRTPEEVEQEMDAIFKRGAKVLSAHAAIQHHIETTKETSGKVQCQCGGELNYIVSSTNGHIWAKCSGCGISFVE